MRKLLLIVLGLMMTGVVSAQRYRTTYFMPESRVAYELNPALMPSQSGFDLPLLGGTYVSATSDIAIDQLLYSVDGELVSFVDDAIDGQTFLNGINDVNNLNMDFSTNVLGIGIRSKKAYFSVDVNLRMFSQTGLAKDWFRLLKDDELSGIYNFDNSNVALTAYGEAALGYSRQITENLTVGAKFKYLAGLGDISLMLDKANVQPDGSQYAASTLGSIKAAMKGMTLGYIDEDGKTYYDLGELEFKPDDISGSGFALDLGVEYNLLNKVTLSAAVLDLGAIKWDEESTIIGRAEQTYIYSSEDDVELDNLYKFQPEASEAYKTKLTTTVLLGAKVPLVGETFTAGALYSYQMRTLKNISSLMLSANYNPFKWLSLAASYTMSENTYKSMGLVLDIHPKSMNLYVGTDYLFFKTAEGGIPKTNAAVLYLGLSKTLGGRK